MADKETADSPTEVSAGRTWFDSLADTAVGIMANASFFLLCLGFLLLWGAVGLVVHVGRWHEWSDTLAVPAAGVTLIEVALLQNESRRNDQATQRKLNAMAGALAGLLERLDGSPSDVEELRAAVGLELRESTGGDTR